MKKRSIVWFRQDLRLHDNEALVDALSSNDEVVFAYIFDERVFKSDTKFGFRKTGPHRARFIIESVLDLKESLKKLGSDLYVRIGKPEVEIFKLAQHIKSNWVYCNRERTQEEVNVQNTLEKNLWSIGQELRFYRGKMLLYTADLPFPVTQTPDVFTQFRKEVENFVAVREPFDSPKEKLEPLSVRIDFGEVPELSEFNHEEEDQDPRSAIPFQGGESAALRRLKYYLWDSKLISNYKETRNGLIGSDYSSKFSPYLAVGCLSPKLIYSEVKKYESIYGANDSTYWLIFELLWRDFFRFMGKKHGNKIFQFTGTRGIKIEENREDQSLINKWTQGLTGIPFIDANMRELNKTGFMSNRGRQNVASFFVKDLKQNWIIGAEYFESLLIDYDPCSNYGNWNYVAGVGSDPRQDRYFNIISQANRYDPDGSFVRHWLPELEDVPNACIHEPTNYYSQFLQKNEMSDSLLPYAKPLVKWS